MEPTGAGRARGFRAPSDDVVQHGAPPAGPEPSQPGETLELGPPPGRVSRWVDNRWAGRRGVVDRRWLLAAAGVLALVLLTATAFRLGSGSAPSALRPPASPTPAPATATALPVTDLYTRLVPSVVLITTSKGSLGSGVVVNATGTVLTARHVVSSGGSISVVFADGTRTTATVATADPKADIATLTPKKLPEVVVPATLGGGVAVGADVVAIGNPLGLRDSTSSGIVSGLGRTTETSTGPLSGLIQFDAAVNPGSSGGPLVDDRGLVVGVVVSIADPGGDDAFAGISFAVPIGTALGGGSGTGSGRGPQL